MLTVTDVHTYYGDSHVLQGVTLRVEKGTVTALLGRNGVGKTTLLRVLMGLLPARSGHVKFDGADIAGLPPYARASLGLANVANRSSVMKSVAAQPSPVRDFSIGVIG